MRLAPALITAAALLLPKLAMADDCARDDTNLTLTARASQQNGTWQIVVRLALTGSAPFNPGNYASFVDVFSGNSRIGRIPVGTVPLVTEYSFDIPVDDYVNRVRAEFTIDPASRNDGQAFNHDCNPADNVVNLRLN